MIERVWLIPLLPLAAAAISALLKNRMRRLASSLAIGAMTLSFILSVFVLQHVIALQKDAHGEPVRLFTNLTWMTLGTEPLQIGFLVDPLTCMMLLVVTFVGLLIFMYSEGYMHDDTNYVRFFCFLSLFAASMLGLVIANSLLILFMCWELVGLCSYLLIGFWYHKPEAAAAAKKAFIVTRVGDIGFFIGLLLLFQKTGTLTLYGQVPTPGILDWDWLHVLSLSPPVQLSFITVSLAGLIALLIFMGAMGKSAQFPLHVWLPDAMEGPTPVSALIHAATMVAAGVFLVARMFPLFELSPTVLEGVAWIGGITAIFAATIAVAQIDIKKVLAYSTISQLGTMMMALGLGGFVAGTFHLMTHAFFKALLFLGSGSVIHGCHGEQNMFRMGGLRKALPTTFWTYLVGALALSGMPPFAGFWSKDEILLDAFYRNRILYVVGTVTAGLTAFYMFRQIFLVFMGHQRSPEFHPHESPQRILWPLRLLALFSIGIGLIGTPFLFQNPFHHFIGPTHHTPEPSWIVMGNLDRGRPPRHLPSVCRLWKKRGCREGSPRKRIEGSLPAP